MLIYPLDNYNKQVVELIIKDPVFAAVFGNYQLDEKNIYIPRERISDPDILNKLISKGILKEP